MALSNKPCALAAERNRVPILGVLRRVLSGGETVLEIGSGTGQHAVYFAAQLGSVTWLTSDLPDQHPVIEAWLAEAALPNVGSPLALDVTAADWPVGTVDAVFSANTAHIMPEPAVRAMFAGVARTLPVGGIFLLYGPFNRMGSFTSESNRQFDAALRRQDSRMGVRDLDQLAIFGAALGLRLEEVVQMPANNLLAIWRRQGGGD